MSEHSAENADTCRIETVDGQALRVRGSDDWDDKDRAAFAEVVRAARRRFDERNPPGSVDSA